MQSSAPGIGCPFWVGSIALAMAVAAGYFLAARLGLALLTEPDGVAVFWPAAGIASGLLIALGPSVRWHVAFGVASATIVANLLGDRDLDASIFFALCNVGEALIIAWLIERHFGDGFNLDSSRRVLGLYLATAVGTAISGIGGTAGFVLFHSSETPILTTWLNWFSSDAIGVVAVAPLVIGLARAWEVPPKMSELVEGLLALGVLTIVSAIGFGAPTYHWFTILPLALIFPLLLWPAAHCRPVFAAAAAFILALIIVWTITFGIGRLGDPSLRLADRVHAAETALLAISLCALGLAALFAERRCSEAALKDSNQRLRLALDGASLGVWSVEAKTGRFENDARDRWIHAHHPNAPPKTLGEARSAIHPDDLSTVDSAFALAARSGSSCSTEYRLAPHTAQGSQERWVALEGTVVHSANGARLLGVTRDITSRKMAEQALAERDAQLAMAAKIARIGSFTFEIGSGEMQVSPGYAAIHDLPEGTVATSRNDWRARVHPDDLPRLDANLQRDIDGRCAEHYCEYRIVRSGGETIRWIEARSFISYDNDGTAQRIIGVNIDVTARKRTAEQQSVLIAELDHRVKNILATVSAVAGQTLETSDSMSGFVAALDGRLRSMASTHELLSYRQWRGIPLVDLLKRELAPYATGHNTEINGPEVILTAEAGQTMAMALHELVTNAAKHGALSRRGGRVLVRWHEPLNGSMRDRLIIEWWETGGPTVTVPSKPGYGTGVITDLIPYELGGKVDLDFVPDGLRCRLEIPGEWIAGASQLNAKTNGVYPVKASHSSEVAHN